MEGREAYMIWAMVREGSDVRGKGLKTDRVRE